MSPARPVSARASRTAAHQPRGSDSRAPSVPVTTCGGLPARDDLARVGIDQQDLGRLGRAIDPGDEPSTRHVRPFRVTPRARPEAKPKGSARTRAGRAPGTRAPGRRRRATGRRWRARAGSGRSRRPAARARGRARSRTRAGPRPRDRRSRCRPGSRRRRRSVRNASPAAARRAASMAAATSAGAPSRPTTSHSSGPSHRTWPSPSVAAVTVFGVGRRRGPRRLADPRQRAPRPPGRRASRPAAAAPMLADRRRRSARSCGGLPVTAPVLRVEQRRTRRSPPRRPRSASGASTVSPIRSRPPSTSASANVRPSAALR